MINKVYFGDCRTSMAELATLGVKARTCVTSPPYFGLRDYGHAGQLGLEETPEQYVAAMVEVFRAVRDVLTDDGTLWINIGDSYAGGGGGNYSKGTRNNSGQNITNVRNRGDWLDKADLKQKDLIGIPWMLAFALRADGWYLRQEIIWHKPNPMPESVRDRCTKAHEQIFLLSKSPRYFYDHEAVKEPAAYADSGRPSKVRGEFAGKTEGLSDEGRNSFRAITETRNKRSVWTVALRPYAGAHFAVYPPELIEPCILAGSAPGDVVLDPFMGSGTTAAVAIKHGRQFLGCELNPEYKALQDERIAQAMADRAMPARVRRPARKAPANDGAQADIFGVAG
jgi:DNA modification methylase